MSVRSTFFQVYSRTIILSLLVLLLVSCWLLVALPARAATLYFSPTSGSYSVGQTFSVSIYAGSTDQSMNAVSGVISFPSDKLQITSLSKSGSVVSLWVQEPSYSNGAGSATFEGIVLNPGYIGSGGKIATVTFRVKQAGVAAVSFSSSSVLANDGKGTNILTGNGTASFSLGTAPAESTTPTVASGAPQAPKINSPTHPNPDKWYAKNDAVFSWTSSGDATAVRILYDKFPYSQPTVRYDASVTKKEVTGITDGIWYFHAQLSNDSGRSAVSHFRFQVDTEKPDSLSVKEVSRGDPTDPLVVFDISAHDALSGIDSFEIKTDDSPAEIWKNTAGENYKTKPLLPGKHTIFVKAYDQAGNYAVDSADFSIEPLESPTITDIKKEIAEGDTISLHGHTKYRAEGDTVLVHIQRGSEPPLERSVRIIDEQGDFTFVLDQKLERGAYSVSLRAVDHRGAQSEDSHKSTIAVTSPGFFALGGVIINYLTVILLVILLLLATLFTALYMWQKFVRMRRKMRQETSDAYIAVTRAFATLRDEVKEQIALLDGKRELSLEEKRLYAKLRDALRLAEKYISRKVKDIDGR